MTKSDALSLIGRILAKADPDRNPSKDEVRTARGMATSLMKKYRITEDDIDAISPKWYGVLRVEMLSLWEPPLMDACARRHRCEADEFTDSDGHARLGIIGARDDAQRAIQAFWYWRQVIAGTVRLLYGRPWNPKVHGSFAVGFACALQDRSKVYARPAPTSGTASSTAGSAQTPSPTPSNAAPASPPSPDERTEEKHRTPRIAHEAAVAVTPLVELGYASGSQVPFPEFHPMLEARCRTHSISVC